MSQATPFKRRLSRVKRMLADLAKRNGDESQALLISSAAISSASRDQDHPFRQSSDFLYLTGSQAESAAILISSSRPRPLIVSTARSKLKAVWDGPGENLRRLASELKADYLESENLEREIRSGLKGVETLFYSSEPNSTALKIARSLFEFPSHQRMGLPKTFVHADRILEPLRVHKESWEVAAIKAANKVTNTALLCALPFATKGRSETSLAATIDYSFRLQGAEPGFNSIVAAGKNAAVLHHKPSASKLKNGDMVLLDVGARLNHYCADITRMIPVGQAFTPIQREIYEIVLSAQKAALSKIRSGVLASAVFQAAARELSYGLRELKVLRQSVSKIMADKLYKPYFPHGIGHTLGLDVHDIGNLRADLSVKLETGMVITVEPGLYFPKPIKKIPACGVRIEDNVLVTRNGCQILSAGFPKEVREVEGLIG